MKRSKLAQRELEALSPGELDLVRFVRHHKKPISIKELARKPEFHGWDHDSLRMMVNNLWGRNMVTWDGDLVGPSFVKSAEELSERVAGRFSAEQE